MEEAPATAARICMRPVRSKNRGIDAHTGRAIATSDYGPKEGVNDERMRMDVARARKDLAGFVKGKAQKTVKEEAALVL